MFRMFAGKLFDLVRGEEERKVQRVLTVKRPMHAERRDLCGPISMLESGGHKEMSSILVDH
jgi:hypothetical protein